MLTYDPIKRPSAEECLRHQFFLGPSIPYSCASIYSLPPKVAPRIEKPVSPAKFGVRSSPYGGKHPSNDGSYLHSIGKLPLFISPPAPSLIHVPASLPRVFPQLQIMTDLDESRQKIKTPINSRDRK